MKSAFDAGYLLRRWRNAMGRRQQDLAAAIGYSPAALNQWESGKRRPPRLAVEGIDDHLGAGGALADFVFAVNTPETLPATNYWMHNFGVGGGAVWAWIRSDRVLGPVDAWIGWGPTWMKCRAYDGGRGLVVSSPISVSNPALVVEIARPGWVDFGRGVVPTWLPIPVVQGANEILPAPIKSNFTIRLVGARLRSLLGQHQRTAAELAHFLRYPVEFVESVLGIPGHYEPLNGRNSTLTEVPFPSGAWVRRLREGRGLSRSDVVRASRSLPGTSMLPEIETHHLRALEAGSQPRLPYLRSRLDMIYRCDGLLANEVVVQGKGLRRLRVDWPKYWVGPVYIEVRPLDVAVQTTEFRWKPYRRTAEVYGPTPFRFRRAMVESDPLDIASSVPCDYIAGVGMNHSATDINEGWTTVDKDDEDQLTYTALKALVEIKGRTMAEFNSFLASGDRSSLNQM